MSIPYRPNENHFPYKEIMILSVVLFSSSVSMTGLFPYVATLVVDVGMSPNVDSAGWYAGFIGGVMMIGRLCSSIYWGVTADRIGRKPVLYIGCVSISVFSILFGVSVNFYMALITRFLLGLFNPIVGLSKTLVSEICHKKYEATGMGVITGCWSLGLIVGPAIGGYLVHPVETYHWTDSNIFTKFLTKFPYFLPNFVTSMLSFTALILTLSHFPETLVIVNSSRLATSNDDNFTLSGETPLDNDCEAQTTQKNTTSNKISSFMVLNYEKAKNILQTLHSNVTLSKINQDKEIGLKLSNNKNKNISTSTKAFQYSKLELSQPESDDKCNDQLLKSSEWKDKGNSNNSSNSNFDKNIFNNNNNNNSLDNQKVEEVNHLIPTNRVRTTPGMSKQELQESHTSTSLSDNIHDNDIESITPTTEPVNLSMYQLIQLPNVLKILIAYVGIAIIDMAFSEALPLWGMSSSVKGGLNLASSQIGNIMTCTGIALVVFTLTVYPILANYLGVAKSFLVGQFIISFMLLSFPFYSTIVHLHQSWNSERVNQFICTGLLIGTKIGSNLAFSSISLAINQSVPTNKRASVNGVAMTLGSAAKAAGPIFGSIIFAWSINNGLSFPFNYYFIFIVLTILSVSNFCWFLNIFWSQIFRTLPFPTIDSTITISAEDHGNVNDYDTNINIANKVSAIKDYFTGIFYSKWTTTEHNSEVVVNNNIIRGNIQDYNKLTVRIEDEDDYSSYDEEEKDAYHAVKPNHNHHT